MARELTSAAARTQLLAIFIPYSAKLPQAALISVSRSLLQVTWKRRLDPFPTRTGKTAPAKPHQQNHTTKTTPPKPHHQNHTTKTTPLKPHHQNLKERYRRL